MLLHAVLTSAAYRHHGDRVLCWHNVGICLPAYMHSYDILECMVYGRVGAQSSGD